MQGIRNDIHCLGAQKLFCLAGIVLCFCLAHNDDVHYAHVCVLQLM